MFVDSSFLPRPPRRTLFAVRTRFPRRCAKNSFPGTLRPCLFSSWNDCDYAVAQCFDLNRAITPRIHSLRHQLFLSLDNVFLLTSPTIVIYLDTFKLRGIIASSLLSRTSFLKRRVLSKHEHRRNDMRMKKILNRFRGTTVVRNIKSLNYQV